MADDDDRDSDAVFFGISDPAVIPEAMVPAFKNLIQALCKTDKQRAQAQAYLDARDMTLNQWLNNLPDEDEDDLSDEEEDELLRDLGYDV
jgi:hypothetical protein